MLNVLLPPIWLIVFIAGLPQLSETVYTPSLPDIAHTLQVSDSLVEYTLTIYLFGFALGTLFWGKLSDKIGRKPCVLIGLCIFIIGCIGCYTADSITWLLLSRLVQAFGGSIGSVIGQAICRDAFYGPELGKMYSSMGSALAVFPAIGPVVGGFIAEKSGWENIFLFLMLCGTALAVMTAIFLPETHQKENRTTISIKKVLFGLAKDKKVLGFGIIVAACNGISFSYFAEGSFYLIELLGLSPSQYGLSFIAIAASTMVGGITSKTLHHKHAAINIMQYGLLIILFGSGIFSAIILLAAVANLSGSILVVTTIVSQMIIMFGVCMATSNALALALVEYKWCIGTASSLFGFFYYSIIALFTFGMGILHNGTLLVMPLYFFAISVFMLLVKKAFVKKPNYCR